MKFLSQEMHNPRKFSTKIFLTLSIRTLSPLLFNFALLEYAIRRVQVSLEGLKLNRTHQLSVYADDNIFILGGSVYTKKEKLISFNSC